MIKTYKEYQYELYERMAKAYYNLVISLDDDIVLKNGLGEGLNKFLSNAYLKSIKQRGSKKEYVYAEKYLTSHFISKEALKLMKDNDFNFSKLENKLRFDHIIPKEQYQKKMIENIKNGTMKEKEISEELKKYWLIATITKSEDENITLKRSMPKDWVYSEDKENIRTRYSEKYNNGKIIEIDENPYLEDLFIEL